MKRGKTLLILCAILVIAIVAIIVEKAVKQHIDTVNTIDEEVFTINEDDLTQVAIEYNDDSVTLVQNDSTWQISDDTDFPVDQDYVADMLSYFESVHASFIIDDVENYAQYGLDSPEATITFTTADGDSVITFGDFSTIDEKRYICVDKKSVYLIDDDILQYVSASQDDFLDRDEINDYSQITSVVVSGDGEANVVYDPDGEYTYTDDYDFYYVDGDDYSPVSESKVTSFVEKLSSMDLTEYETYKATDDDLAEYGLDNPTLTVTITGEIPADDSEEDSDDAAVESQTQSIYFAKADDADTAYLYFEGSTIVYAITADDYDDIADVSYSTLRPSEVVSIDWTNVAQLSVDIDDETYIVNVEYDEDDGNTYTVDDETVDFVTATSLIDSLSLTEVGDDYSKGTEELAFAITLNDEDATVVNVVLYQYDGDSCVVAVDGKTVGLCSRTSMSSLREEITSSILNKGKEVEETEEDSTTDDDLTTDYNY